MDRTRWRLLLACLVLQTGLAPLAWAQHVADSPFDSALSKRAKVVGVMVASGYQVQVVTLGTLLNVGRLERNEPRDDDLLSDRVFAGIKSELALERRYEVRRLQVNAEQARKLTNSLWNRREDRFGSWPTEMKDLVANCDCDAVLVVADGPSHNTMVEAGLTFGPSFVGKSGVFGGKDVARAHFRAGLLTMLVDPKSGERIRTATAHDRPDYQEDAKAFWPGSEGSISDTHWNRMARYLEGLGPVYRKSLSMVGLRPSCAHRYAQANTNAMAARSGEPPPPPVVEDTTRCPLDGVPALNG